MDQKQIGDRFEVIQGFFHIEADGCTVEIATGSNDGEVEVGHQEMVNRSVR